MTVEDRFFSRVDKSGECWVWRGAKSPSGYGVFPFTHTKQMRAHRMSWVLANGEIPDGMVVCHKCDVRDCVNPEHLFLGTLNDNVQDCIRKGRSSCCRGESSNLHKLTEEQVLKIRSLHGKMYHREIGAIFGITRECVGAIVRGKSWKHILDGSKPAMKAM